MKIWIVQDILRSGGTERQTVLLARAFADAGHTVTVATFRPGGRLADSLGSVERLCLQLFDTGLNWFAPGLTRAARRARPGVVLCMGRMANCHAGRLAHALPGSAVVGTMRTGKSLPWLFRRSLRRVAHVVANSVESARLLHDRYGVPPDRVSVIRNALVFPADARNDGRSHELRAGLGASPSTVVLLCVGMMRPEKNQRALIEYAAALGTGADWQLWFVGDGPVREACASLSARLGVADRVKFLGFQADPTPFYHAADLAVLASRAESLSNFLIEAQAHGLPAVACAAAGVTECMQPGASGFVVPHGDQAAFLAALRPLIENPALRAQTGREAAAFARKAFDPARQARAYLDLFARLSPAA